MKKINGGIVLNYPSAKEKLNMKICKICVMNDSIKEFKLNENKICNFCLQWDKEKIIS